MTETVDEGSAIGGRAAVRESVPSKRPSPVEVQEVIERQLGMTLEEAGNVAWQVAIRLSRDRERAQDLCQAVFTSISAKVVDGSLQIVPGSGAAYVRRAAANAFRDDHRYWTAAMRGGGVAPEVIGVDVVEDRVASTRVRDPLDLVVAAELSDSLFAAICTLQPAQRQVMLLLVQGGLSVNGIADMLDLPVSTVRNRVIAARSEIRGRLRRAGLEVGR